MYCKNIIVLFLLISTEITFAQPKILLDSAYADPGHSSIAAGVNFGKVHQTRGWNVVRKFAVRFTNIGDSVLKIVNRRYNDSLLNIMNFSYADGGVYAHYLRKEIPPGEGDSMIVELESINAWSPGIYHRCISIQTNDKANWDFLVLLTWEIVSAGYECERDTTKYPSSQRK